MLNGFHETWPIVYPEDAYGLARTGQTIVNATDGSIDPAVRRRRAASTSRPRGCCASSACSTCAPACSAARSSSRRARGAPAARALAPARLARATATSPPSTTRSSRSTPPSRIAISSELVTHGRRRGRRRPAPRQGLRREGRSSRSPRAPSSTRAVAVARHAQQRARAGLRDGARRSRRPPGHGRDERATATAPRSSCSPSSSAGEPLRLSQVRRLPLGAPRRRAGRPASRASTARSTARARDGYDVIELAHAAASRTSGARSDVQIEGAPDLQQAVRFNLFAAACRRPRAARASACRPRASPAAATRATTSGTPRSTSCRSSSTRTRSGPVRCSTSASGCSTPRAARAGGRPRGRAVPVAHDQRRGGLRVVRGRHRAVPHQRRRRLRDAPVQPRHRRPRLPARPGRRGAGRDRALLDAARLLLRAPRRALLHQQRDRARRVHDGRRQQRLHEPDGQGEPRGRHARHRVARGRRPGRARGARPRHRADRRRGRRLAPRRRAHVRPAPRGARHRPPGRALPRAQALGLRRARRRRSTRCCCTTTRSSSTATR